MTPVTTRAEARRSAAAAFRAAGVDTPDLDARLLVCAAAGIDHAGLIRDPDEALGAASDRLAGFVARRLAREPVSRILGRREFWGLPWSVTPDVLDPRPETEGLVASVLDAVGGRRDRPLSLLDLGTGSGAIVGSLLRELPAARGLGVDRSLAACAVARGNLSALGVAHRAAIVCGDWTEALGGRFDVIVSNPPYIATGDIVALAPDVRDHDPPAALDGGRDGLAAYRRLVAHLDRLLAEDGVVAFECGAGQGRDVARLMEAAGLAGAAVYRDFAGHDRIVIWIKAAA